MKTRFVPMGNSQGIRIPKLLIEQAGLSSAVEISVQEHSLVIKPARKPRAGWAESFKETAQRGDDELLDDGASTKPNWDEDEWE